MSETTDRPAELSTDDRLARLEVALADQEAKNEALAEQLREATQRPEKLRGPGQFVGREGAPDSPAEDHYTLLLANGDQVPAVHPNASHVSVDGVAYRVMAIAHDRAVHEAQHSQAA